MYTHFWPRLYCVNLLKAWQEREDPGYYNAEIDLDEEGREWSHELQAQVATGLPASKWQLHQIKQVLVVYADMFRDTPRTATGVAHYIPTPPRWLVRVPLCPTPLTLKKALDKEVQSMLGGDRGIN